MRGQLRRHQEEGGRSWSNSEFRSGYSGTPTHPSIHPSNHPSLPRLREARGSVRACCLPSSFLWPVLVRVPSLIVGGGRGGQRQRCQHEECVCTRPHPSFVHRARPVASPFPPSPPSLLLAPRPSSRPSIAPPRARPRAQGRGWFYKWRNESLARADGLRRMLRQDAEMSPDYAFSRCCNI